MHDDETPAHTALLQSVLHREPNGFSVTCAACKRSKSVSDSTHRAAWTTLRGAGWSVAQGATIGLLCDQCTPS